MRKVFLCMAALAANVGWAAPQAAYYYPCGVQAGTTNRIIVGGQGFWGVRGAWISGEGVSVVRCEKVPGFPTQGGGEGEVAWVSEWLEGVWDGKKSKPLLPDFKSLRTWRRCPWWDTLDKRDPLELSIIAREIYIRKNPLQTSPALAQQVVLDVVARADAPPGRRDIILYDDRGASAPHAFFVTAAPHAREALFAPPSKRKPDTRIFDLPIVLNGQIMPGETDGFKLNLPKGGRLLCTLTGRELLPYIGDAVPGFFNPVVRLVDESGHVVAVANDFAFLPDPVLDYDIPADGVYTLEVHDNLFRGRADFVYAVSCRIDAQTRPVPQERAFLCYPPAAAHRPPDAAGKGGYLFKGTIDYPGCVAYHTFEVKSPATLSFELFARRSGSPLDGRLELYGPEGFLPVSLAPRLALWDDVTNKLHAGSVPQIEADPTGTYAFTTPGRYRVAVTDAGGAGGVDFSYALSVAPAKPSFEVYSVGSSFVFPAQGPARASFKVRVVRRGGFAGAVTLENSGDFTFDRATIPADRDEAEVSVSAKEDGEIGMKTEQFYALGEIAPGEMLRVPLQPADEVQQAFAYTHLLPAQAFFFYTPKYVPPPTEMPDWIAMPADILFPRRIVLPTAPFAPKGDKVDAALHNAVNLSDTVPVAYVPHDAHDSVLAVRFAASAAHLQGVREVVAREPEKGKVDRAACAYGVLAGLTRLVAGGMRYADGDDMRVRSFARAAATPVDHDMLLLIPEDDASPLSGTLGNAARRLRDDGWCFDFTTAASLPEDPVAKGYRVLYVPKLKKPLDDAFFARLVDLAEKKGFVVLFEEALPPAAKNAGFAVKQRRGEAFSKGRGKIAVGTPEFLLGRMSPARAARREAFADLGAVRFIRRGGRGRDAWYFLYNPLKKKIAGDWRFNFQGTPRMAVAMDVESGKIAPLESRGRGVYAYTLAPGASAWICVTARDLTAVRGAEGVKPGHGGGRACNSCHDAPRKR